MNINIHAPNIHLDASEQGKVRDQIKRALSGFADRVRAIDVYIKDVNGPRGGNDKSVVIHVRLTGRTVLASSSLKSKLLAASAAAANKIRRRVKSALRRQRRFERQSLNDARPAMTDMSLTRRLFNA